MSINSTPSLIDVILTSNAKRMGKVLNFDCGLSDYHNLLATCTKMDVAKPKAYPIAFRSYKDFDEEAFKRDMDSLPLSVIETFDDVSDKHWAYSQLVMPVVNQHAPLKTRYETNRCAHMNSKLRKAIYIKRVARNRHLKAKGDDRLWEAYRKARNSYVNENRKSMQNYFQKECHAGAQSKSFWDAIKPYFSEKTTERPGITLRDEESVITDCNDVASVFSVYFRDIVRQMGNGDEIGTLSLADIGELYENHPSVRIIQRDPQLNRTDNAFQFTCVSVSKVSKLLAEINTKKSTGYDQLPGKLVRKAAEAMAPMVTRLVNDMINQCHFPDDMKLAEIAPVFKKGDALDKSKYRPVSVLTCVSKVFEKVINQQFAAHFYGNYAKNLSAYRKNCNTQSVLLKAVDDWKTALDQGKAVGALLMDLSKAFDVIPHGLLLAKMKAYGYSDEVTSLMRSYLAGRKQRVKVKDARSEWITMNMGVPQGSVLGPTLFNVFLNDLLLHMDTAGVAVYNYADDNTLSVVSDTVGELIHTINRHGTFMTEWFTENGMKANPDKYQAIIFGKAYNTPTHFSIHGTDIIPGESVKLLGVHIDERLNFGNQAAAICKKASKQVNAMMRLARVMDTSTKLNVYASFILSNFMYCPAVWLCNKTNLNQLEKVNCRALRFVYDDFNASYDELLLRGNHRRVKVIIMHALATEVYKCLHDLSPEYLLSTFHFQSHDHNTRNQCVLVQPQFRTYSHGFQSFSYLGARIYNHLPNDIKNASCLNSFKRKLHSFTDTACMDRII